MKKIALVSTLLFAACGGGDDSNNPDAPPHPDGRPDAPQAGVCGTAAGHINTYPGTFNGDTTGAGAEFDVAQGACTTENAYFEPIGEDQVVQLDNLTPGQNYFVSVDSADADLSFYVATDCDAAGPTQGSCLLFNDAQVAGTAEINVFTAPTSGTAAVIVDSFDDTMAGAYTLSVGLAECTDSFGCTDANTPVCNASFTCEAGPNDCTGDDAGDGTPGGDDGPAGATAITTSPQVVTGAVCSSPGEADWYAVTVADGEGIDLSVAFDPTMADIDVVVLTGQNRLVGLTFWQNPEHVRLTYLPAGTYYFVLSLFNGDTVAQGYTATFTKTPAQTCATSADCATEFETQIYRGTCSATGACDFTTTTGGANGSPCDSPDNCTSGFCSYISFESDAQDSVCSDSCTAQADCDAIGPGLACTTAFGTNFCLPSCATDLECGTIELGSDPDPGLPWQYMTCTVATGVCGPDGT